jgi:hypothetical protein|tara:strand:- start:497 stop:748 length:252 start_codon:yes stop_codon:yes gene_type:complete
MEYKVVPFIANIEKGQGAEDAAEQLQELINNNSGKDWAYVRMETIDIIVHDPGTPASGCFGSTPAVPASTVSMKYDMVVFQKK